MTLAPAPEKPVGNAPIPSAAQLALADKLNDPVVANALTSLLDRADLIAVLVDSLDGFIARTEVIGDSLADGFSEMRNTVAGNESLQKVSADVPRILDTATRLVSSDLMDPAAVDRISVLARGLVRGGDTYERNPVEIGGALALLKLLKDPDINRAISYFATVAKAMGQEIAATSAARSAPSSQPAAASTQQ